MFNGSSVQQPHNSWFNELSKPSPDSLTFTAQMYYYCSIYYIGTGILCQCSCRKQFQKCGNPQNDLGSNAIFNPDITVMSFLTMGVVITWQFKLVLKLLFVRMMLLSATCPRYQAGGHESSELLGLIIKSIVMIINSHYFPTQFQTCKTAAL